MGMIVLNCEEPWDIAKELRQWIDVLMEILEEFMKELPLDTQDMLRNKSKDLNLSVVTTYIKKYKTPSLDEEGNIAQGR